jgi:hypothetical protein
VAFTLIQASKSLANLVPLAASTMSTLTGSLLIVSVALPFSHFASILHPLAVRWAAVGPWCAGGPHPAASGNIAIAAAAVSALILCRAKASWKSCGPSP